MLKVFKTKIGNARRRYIKSRGGRGVIEKLTAGGATGWLVTNIDKRPSSCIVHFDKKDYEASVDWTYRNDISNAYAAWSQECGFSISFPTRLKELLYFDADYKKKVKVSICDIDVKNPFLNNSFKQYHRRTLVSSLNIVKGESMAEPLALDSFSVYILGAASLDTKKIELQVNGRLITCLVTKESNFFIDNKIDSVKTNQHVYCLELPGLVWRFLNSGERELSINVSYDGRLLLEKLVSVSVLDVSTWIKEVLDGRFGNESHFNVLALEHFNFLSRIDPYAVKEFDLNQIQEKSKLFNVPFEWKKQPDYMPVALENDSDWEFKKKVLEDFNLQVSPGSKLINLALELVGKYSLNSEQSFTFLHSLSSYFCQEGQFSDLADAIDRQKLKTYTESKSFYRLSETIPYYAYWGDIERASNLLLSLVGRDIWIATPCLYTSLRKILENEGLLTESKHKFASSFIKYLEGFDWTYWQRDHDEYYVKSILCLLEYQWTFSKSLQCKILNIFYRHYSLSPVFWKSVNYAKSSYLGIDHAYTDFELISALFKRLGTLSKKQFREEYSKVRAVLDGYIQRGTIDAWQFKRELSQYGIQLTGGEVLEITIEQLASPYFKEDKNIIGSIKLHHLFNCSDYSEQYELQKQVSKLLRQDLEGEFYRLNSALCTSSHGYLGLDFYVQKLHYCIETVSEDDLAKVAGLIVQAQDQCGSEEALPAPLYAAMVGFEKLLNNEKLSTFRSKFQLRLDPAKGISVESNEVHDTVLLIYTCQKNLNSRVEAIRNSWLKDLIQQGIPYLIVVGGSDKSELKEDILYLSAGDAYEDLPEKSVSMFTWLYENTNYQYMIKLDDDCVMNVEEYFDSASYRKHHYYGHSLYCSEGKLDRKWHQEKSTTEFAKFSLDKSPEPSMYANGATGYSLSRYAVSHLVNISRTIEGQRLIQSSFFEDKLIGDLLGYSGIQVSEEDFYIHVLRKTTVTGAPVPIWENHFLPSRSAPAKVIHTDSGELYEQVMKYKNSTGLYPSKIFPTHSPAKIKGEPNQLVLLSDLKPLRGRGLMDVCVVSVVFNEMIMLPSFLEHYRKLGVHSFIFADNLSTDGTREFLLSQPDVVLYSADTQYKSSHYGVEWQQAMLASHNLNRWALVADADEFIVYPDMEDRALSEYISEVEARGGDAVSLYMVDMYPKAGLETADFTVKNPFIAAPYFDRKTILQWNLDKGYFSNSKVKRSGLRHRLTPTAQSGAFVTQKRALLKYRPWMKLSEGLHYVGATNVDEIPIAFAHFKYHAAFKAKVELEIQRKQHYNDAEEYFAYRTLLAESEGNLASEDDSLKYESSSQFLKEVCK